MSRSCAICCLLICVPFLYRNILSVLLNVVIIFFLLHCVIKQLLDSVVVISRIFKVLVRAISRTPP